MSLIAVLTNCAHLALTSRQLDLLVPNMSDALKIALIFGIEVRAY